MRQANGQTDCLETGQEGWGERGNVLTLYNHMPFVAPSPTCQTIYFYVQFSLESEPTGTDSLPTRSTVRSNDQTLCGYVTADPWWHPLHCTALRCLVSIYQ